MFLKKDNKKNDNQNADYYYERAAKHENEMKGSWKAFLKTGVIVVAAVAAIIIAGVAWFVSNNRVSGNGSRISAQNDSIKIAGKGVRQSAETEHLELVEGAVFTYEAEDYYYTEGGEIAFRLQDEYELRPGTHGEIEFYIIPKKDGNDSITLYVNLEGYKNDTVNNTVARVDDRILNALLEGHLLMFGEKDPSGAYDGWMHSEGTLQNAITINLDASAKAEVPYLCRIYWVWPKVYSDLADIQTVSDFINSESSEEKAAEISGGGGYRYSRLFIANTFPVDTTAARTHAYNLADEYIGSNMDYVYLTISTSPVETGDNS